MRTDEWLSLHLRAWGTLNLGVAARPVTGYNIEVGCGWKSGRFERVLLFRPMRNKGALDDLDHAVSTGSWNVRRT